MSDVTNDRVARSRFRSVLFYAFCVILPFVALAFELATHGCLEILFDPIPRWLHVALVASVPAAVLFSDSERRRGVASHAAVAAAGFAAAVAAFYILLFVPILPFALIGMLFGLGVLPFAPVGGLVGALSQGLPLARKVPRGRRTFWSAAACGVAVVVALEVPGWMVVRGLETESVELLERWGSRDALLRAAQGGTSTVNLTAHLRSGYIPFDGQGPSGDELTRNRRLFYRVTGEDSTLLEPPRLPGASEPNLMDGPRRRSVTDAPGLSLESSRIDAAAFADEGLAYLEWTLVFRNDSFMMQEARARLLLPAGGIVTRANLWIDGEEREAAFGARAQVREAYEAIAIVQRRDPLLVTSDRPGEADIRAFPVLANGTMRIRVGVTAPLELAARERAVLALPAVADSNFEIASDLEHQVWIDSRTPILAAPTGLTERSESSGVNNARGTLRAGDAAGTVELARSSASADLVALDGSAEPQAWISQRIEAARPAPRRWIVVIDGSAGAEPHRERIAGAIEALPHEQAIGLVVAAEEPLWLLEPDSSAIREAIDRLRGMRFRGGRDNQAALEAAFDQALASSASLLWLGAGQPLLLGPTDSLLQRLERRRGVEVVAMPLTARHNALLAALPHPRVRVVRSADLGAGIAALGDSGSDHWRFVRERLTQPSVDRTPLPADHDLARHLSRLWANDEVARRLAEPPVPDEVAVFAASHRIVTPLSGAVVLETEEQYRAANLTTPGAGDDPTMPSIPEPETALSIGLGLALLAARRARAR